jgi:hypothetical protein
MSINRCITSGTISTYGTKLSYTESGKPQTTFSLIVGEPGRAGASYKTFIPCSSAVLRPRNWLKLSRRAIRSCLQGSWPIRPAKWKTPAGCWSPALPSRSSKGRQRRLRRRQCNVPLIRYVSTHVIATVMQLKILGF